MSPPNDAASDAASDPAPAGPGPARAAEHPTVDDPGKPPSALRLLGWLTVGLVSLTIGLAPTALEKLRAAGVLMAITDQPRPTLLSALEYPVTRSAETLTLAAGTTPAFRYRPEGLSGAPPLVLLHGVHPEGIHEPRLTAFARAMAAAGLDVLTPSLPELARFQVTQETLPRLVQSVRMHASRTGNHTAGVIGISFAGGLSLIAAAQPQAAWARFIVAVGAHHDLARLANYYAGNDIKGPHGATHTGAAHPYGARVIIHAHAEHFFQGEDIPLARDLLGRWLAGQMAEARRDIDRLSPAGREAMAEVLDFGNRAPLGAQMLAAVTAEAETLAAASPAGKLTNVRVPVFAIHGEDDPIIPSSESRWIEDELGERAHARVLITPVFRHAELLDQPALTDYWEVVDFMASILHATTDATMPGGP